MPDPTGRTHFFHADASALGGHLTRPLERVINAQASVSLPVVGGFASALSGAFHVDQLISFSAAESKVAGNRSEKRPAWTTLVTTSIENFNALDVVKADRMVAQIATEHPDLQGKYAPRVTFVGTQFQNLLINGHKVDLTLDFGPLGVQDEGSYPETGPLASDEFLSWGSRSGQPGSSAQPNAPAGVQALKAAIPSRNSVLCSIVKSVAIDTKTGPFAGTVNGSVITIPDFGTIHLGELVVDQNSYQLTMVRLELGCLAQGQVGVSTAKTNGTSYP